MSVFILQVQVFLPITLVPLSSSSTVVWLSLCLSLLFAYLACCALHSQQVPCWASAMSSFCIFDVVLMVAWLLLLTFRCCTGHWCNSWWLFDLLRPSLDCLCQGFAIVWKTSMASSTKLLLEEEDNDDKVEVIAAWLLAQFRFVVVEHPSFDWHWHWHVPACLKQQIFASLFSSNLFS